MKYCSHCGAQLLDEAVVCPKCGCPTESKKPVVSENRSGLGTAARVFMIIQCVALVAFLLIIFLMFIVFAGILSEGLPPMEGEQGMPEVLTPQMIRIMGGIYCGVLAIPLLWIIPMTVSLGGKLKRGEHVSLAFKVCTLIFVNVISGILLLCMNER